MRERILTREHLLCGLPEFPLLRAQSPREFRPRSPPTSRSCARNPHFQTHATLFSLMPDRPRVWPVNMHSYAHKVPAPALGPVGRNWQTLCTPCPTQPRGAQTASQSHVPLWTCRLHLPLCLAPESERIPLPPQAPGHSWDLASQYPRIQMGVDVGYRSGVPV